MATKPKKTSRRVLGQIIFEPEHLPFEKKSPIRFEPESTLYWSILYTPLVFNDSSEIGSISFKKLVEGKLLTDHLEKFKLS